MACYNLPMRNVGDAGGKPDKAAERRRIVAGKNFNAPLNQA